ncbi:MAG: hypothetical protein CMP48_03165 [Rickettsiales bacterium]|nr:hypothetical protein [Rickettsiales bacterium]
MTGPAQHELLAGHPDEFHRGDIVGAFRGLAIEGVLEGRGEAHMLGKLGDHLQRRRDLLGPVAKARHALLVGGVGRERVRHAPGVELLAQLVADLPVETGDLAAGGNLFRHRPAEDRIGPAFVDGIETGDVGDDLRPVEHEPLVVAVLVDHGLHAGRLVVGDLEHLVHVGEFRHVAAVAAADLLEVVEHHQAAGLVDEPDHRLLGAGAEDMAVVAEIGETLGGGRLA